MAREAVGEKADAGLGDLLQHLLVFCAFEELLEELLREDILIVDILLLTVSMSSSLDELSMLEIVWLMKDFLEDLLEALLETLVEDLLEIPLVDKVRVK